MHIYPCKVGGIGVSHTAFGYDILMDVVKSMYDPPLRIVLTIEDAEQVIEDLRARINVLRRMEFIAERGWKNTKKDIFNWEKDGKVLDVYGASLLEGYSV